MIGPLPATNATTIEPLTFPFQNSEPGRTDVHPLYSPVDAVQFETTLSADIEDITKELWNSVGTPRLLKTHAHVM